MPNGHQRQFSTQQAKRSKIFISIVYLWTGRGPEINNGAGTGRGPYKRKGVGEELGGQHGRTGAAAKVAAGSAAAQGGAVLAHRAGVRTAQRGCHPQRPGARRVRGGSGAGLGARGPGTGVVAAAGRISGGDERRRIGAAGRDELES